MCVGCFRGEQPPEKPFHAHTVSYGAPRCCSGTFRRMLTRCSDPALLSSLLPHPPAVSKDQTQTTLTGMRPSSRWWWWRGEDTCTLADGRTHAEKKKSSSSSVWAGAEEEKRTKAGGCQEWKPMKKLLSRLVWVKCRNQRAASWQKHGVLSAAKRLCLCLVLCNRGVANFTRVQ